MEALTGAYWSSGICMGITGFGGCIGIGIMMAKVFEGLSRQPETVNTMRPLIFIGIAFIEAITLYALVISILLLTKTA